MSRRFSHVLSTALVTLFVCLCLAGCGFGIEPVEGNSSVASGSNSASSSSPTSSSSSASSSGTDIVDVDATDQMWTDHKEGVELDIVVYEGEPILIPSGERLRYNFDADLKEGHFYHAIADVDYLNGGIAGYYNYPEVQNVISVKEVPGNDIAMPTVKEESYGVIRLDGYAEGDYLLNEYGNAAVLKGNEWIYKYDKSKRREDGTVVLFKSGVGEETIDAGVAKGTICCEDYYLLPSTE